MAYISPWYKEAYFALDLALDILPRDCTDKALIKAVAREAYPFGPRNRYPYTQWLKARKLVLWQKFPKVFKAPPTARPRGRPPGSGRVAVISYIEIGQLPLFEDEAPNANDGG